jgi:hypothetical protein
MDCICISVKSTGIALTGLSLQIVAIPLSSAGMKDIPIGG